MEKVMVVEITENDGKPEREFKLNFELKKDDKGKIKGFTVTAQAQGEAEWFCITFLRAITRDNAGIILKLRRRKIVLFNKECPFQPAECGFRLDPVDIKQLHDFYNNGGQFTVKDLRPDKIGFSIIHA